MQTFHFQRYLCGDQLCFRLTYCQLLKMYSSIIDGPVLSKTVSFWKLVTLSYLLLQTEVKCFYSQCLYNLSPEISFSENLKQIKLYLLHVKLHCLLQYIFYIMKNVHAYLMKSPHVKPAAVDNRLYQPNLHLWTVSKWSNSVCQGLHKLEVIVLDIIFHVIPEIHCQDKKSSFIHD